MKRYFLVAALAMAVTGFVTPSMAADPKPTTGKEMKTEGKMSGTSMWTDAAKMKEHINHIKYGKSGLTKAEMLKACKDMSDVPQADKDMFASMLPEGTYTNAEQVMKALNMSM